VLWPLSSVPAPATVKTAAAKYEQDNEDDQKCVGIHGSLLGEIEPTSSAQLFFTP
jgi:hypothetical protein